MCPGQDDLNEKHMIRDQAWHISSVFLAGLVVWLALTLKILGICSIKKLSTFHTSNDVVALKEAGSGGVRPKRVTERLSDALWSRQGPA